MQFAAPPDLNYTVVDGSTDIFVPCFLPGTHILTDRGEVLVEKLQVGDTIVTSAGGSGGFAGSVRGGPWRRGAGVAPRPR